MGTALTSATIGKNTKFAPDVIWDDEAGPDDATVTSAEFQLAQTLGRTQLKLVAGTDGLTTGGANRVTIKVITAPATGGTFDNVAVEHLLPISTTYAAGADIFSFIPPQELAECYAKISATVATDNLSAADLTAFTIEV